ncbi:MAG: ChbG/HpnK family deacetylase [Planctomycetes bacterium]|nr:ChbG/HpnK family deacetylase [Planctomycetota bacterium]
MNSRSDYISLIINADDYAYFESVSKGIIEGAKAGVITATGIMANSPHLNECLEWLKEVPNLDLGVHLNITYGQPLSSTMTNKLEFNDGVFPGKFTVVKALMQRKILIADVVNEWRTQILHCVNNNITVSFLNSHEHMHMFPGLFQQTTRLAAEFDIPHLRFSTPDWRGKFAMSCLVRNTLMQAMVVANARKISAERKLPLLGINDSGKLSINYIQRILATLKPGRVYELMCHPGHFDQNEIRDPGLIDYHHWESELTLLKSQKFNKICNEYGVQLVGYRDFAGMKGSYEN